MAKNNRGGQRRVHRVLKHCYVCGIGFLARCIAKTCSPRCRKVLSRHMRSAGFFKRAPKKLPFLG
jgi:predicted nucleic acid-binding Zn ribbon protein